MIHERIKLSINWYIDAISTIYLRKESLISTLTYNTYIYNYIYICIDQSIDLLRSNIYKNPEMLGGVSYDHIPNRNPAIRSVLPFVNKGAIIGKVQKSPRVGASTI